MSARRHDIQTSETIRQLEKYVREELGIGIGLPSDLRFTIHEHGSSVHRFSCFIYRSHA